MASIHIKNSRDVDASVVNCAFVNAVHDDLAGISLFS